MSKGRLSIHRSLMLACAPVTAAIGAPASYDFIKIADTSTVMPGGLGMPQDYSDPAIDGDQVIFRARFEPTSTHQAIATFNPLTGLAVLADYNTTIPGSSATAQFMSQYPAIHGGRGGFVMARIATSDQAVVTAPAGGGPLATLATHAMLVPGGSAGETFSFLGEPRLHSGQAIFRGQGSLGTKGVYARSAGGDGTIRVVADSGTTIPGAAATFSSFNEYDLGSNGAFFVGQGASGAGVYHRDLLGGPLQRIADTTQAFPASGGGNYALFAEPAIDGDDVVFHAQNAAGKFAVLKTSVAGGAMQVIADATTLVPGTGVVFDLALPTDMDNGEIALLGISTGFTRAGLYAVDAAGTIRTVIDSDAVLDGKDVVSFMPSNKGLSDGVYAVGVDFSDGTNGIYVALPEHRWLPDAGGFWDDSVNWTFSTNPRNVVHASIAPTGGAVVIGSRLRQHLRSLTIGAIGSGIAELHLEPTGHLSVDETLLVQSTGLLKVGGVVHATDALMNDGILSGSGQVDAALVNQSTGQVRVGAGDHLRFSGPSSHTSAGLIEVIGGQIEFTRPLSNVSPGQLAARNATVRFNAGLTNTGDVAFSFGTSDVLGSVTSGGRIIVTGNSNVTFWHNLTNSAGGIVQVSSGSTAVFLGNVSNAGTFSGGGIKLFESGSSGVMADLATTGSTIVAYGASITASHIREQSLTVHGAARILPDGTSSGTSRLDSLAVTGRLDLSDNKLIVAGAALGTFDGSVYTGIAGLVDSGRGDAGDALWNGNGIVTTDTRAIGSGNLASLGVATAAQTGKSTFGGLSVAPGDVLVMLTWGGDANLDGKINIDDYGRIDGNVASSGSVFGWFNGDFNYDGKINIDDYGIIDGNINRQGAAFAVSDVAASGASDGVAAVPEPGGVAALGVLGVLAGRRTRRRDGRRQ